MKLCFAALLVMAMGLALCAAKPALASVDAPFKGLPKVELSFDLDGQQPEWALQSQTTSQANYTWQGYNLNLRLEKRGIQQILRLKMLPPSGQKLSVSSYAARVVLPTTGLHSVVVPNTRILAHTLIYYHEHRKWPENPSLLRCLIPGGFEEEASANKEGPFILLADDKGNNKFSVGWAYAETNTQLKGAAEGDNYILTLSRQNDIPTVGDQFEDALIISSESKPWFDVERAYAIAFDKYNGRSRTAPPAWTSEPVFCTWYCYDDRIDQEGVLKIARKCKELGFGTILIDAGWDAHPNGGYGDFQNGILGDFIAMPDRFPNLAEAVKQMHDMGLRVELWSAPFWQGKKSKAYQEKTKDWHAWTAEGEARDLCPKHPGTRLHFREQFEWVARTYGIDGMWLDAMDGVPSECIAKHEHLDQPMGEAYVDCVAAIRDGLRAVNPEAITEGRVLHANINSKRAFDIVQPSDAPKSFEMLRLAGIHMRPWAYDVVFKNDPMIWPNDADAATVGKFLATMVCNGVPALSVDFLTAPEEHCAITKAWLSFYKEHKKTLLNGKFQLFGENYGIPDMMLIGDREAVVYLKNPKTKEVNLPQSIKKVILLNCMDTDRLDLRIKMAKGNYNMQSYKPDWTKKGFQTPMECDGAMSLYHMAPQGGATVITQR